MDQLFVGLDVAKDHLDVHARPSGAAFVVAHDEAGLTELVARLRVMGPSLIVLEATGGYEATVAATLASAELPVAVVNPRQIRDFARATERSPRPMPWTPRSSRGLPKRSAPRSGPCPLNTPSAWASSSPAGVSSWRCSGRSPIGGALSGIGLCSAA